MLIENISNIFNLKVIIIDKSFDDIMNGFYFYRDWDDDEIFMTLLNLVRAGIKRNFQKYNKNGIEIVAASLILAEYKLNKNKGSFKNILKEIRESKNSIPYENILKDIMKRDEKSEPVISNYFRMKDREELLNNFITLANEVFYINYKGD